MNGVFHMGFSWIFWIFVIMIFLWVIITNTNRNRGEDRPNESAIDILKKRYASGEIDKVEFDKMKKEIKALR